MNLKDLYKHTQTDAYGLNHIKCECIPIMCVVYTLALNVMFATITSMRYIPIYYIYA